MNNIRIPIVCFRGIRDDPRWLDEESSKLGSSSCIFLIVTVIVLEMYSTLCHVEADLSALPKYPQTSSFDSSNYYSVSFEVVLTLGLTEDRAIIAWKQDVCQVFLQIWPSSRNSQGVEKRRVTTSSLGLRRADQFLQEQSPANLLSGDDRRRRPDASLSR